MAPRPRSRRYRDLPENLEPDAKTVSGKRVVYYRYAFPDGRRKGLGKDKQHAIAVARALNEKLRAPDVRRTVTTLLGSQVTTSKGNPPLKAVVAEFRERFLPEKTYSKKTRDEIEYKLAKYERDWGNQTVQTFTTLQIAGFLNELSVSAYIKHRKLLLDLFAFAGHQGYIQANPVAMTLAKSDSQRQKKRKRHTVEGYHAIHKKAEPWLQRAMDIAVRSLQREGDLTSLHKDQVNLERGTIRILQHKTKQYREPVYIEIKMGPELEAVVRSCLSTGIPCPYLIHRRPLRQASAKKRSKKRHPFAVTEDYLSKAFAKARDAAGVYDDMEPGEKPSFHDLRALGEWLYEKAGYSDEYINALGGWASNKMREHYGEGHEEKAPKIVQADLEFPESSPKATRT